MSSLSQQLHAALANVESAYEADLRSEAVVFDDDNTDDEDEKAPVTLKRSLHNILDSVEELKESITDQQYLRMTKRLKAAYDLIPDTTEYKVFVESFYVESRYPNGIEVKSKTTMYRMHLNDTETRAITEYLHIHQQEHALPRWTPNRAH